MLHHLLSPPHQGSSCAVNNASNKYSETLEVGARDLIVAEPDRPTKLLVLKLVIILSPKVEKWYLTETI